MFNFLKKQKPSDISNQDVLKQSPNPVIASLGIPRRGNPEIITLKLSGLHCTSCATNIDLTLEDLPSVKSNTNYAKQETNLEFDPTKTSLKEIKSTITSLGYKTVS